MIWFLRSILPILVIALLTAGCAKYALVPVPLDQFPYFSDDMQYRHLQPALDRSLRYLRAQPATALVTVHKQRVPVSRLIESLAFFQRLIESRPGGYELNRLVRKYFDIYQATGTEGFNPERSVLVTGYYQPIFNGSLVRDEPFIHPLYTIPNDLVLQHSGSRKKVGRFEGAAFTGYWTRGEIDTQRKASGYELVWLADPVDAFILHIQGSGLIQLPDGQMRGVHYALSNGQPYRSIGRLMVETGRMSLDEASMDAIRAYLSSHPEERDEILHHNDSFIFFDWTTTMGAIGSLGQELIAGRSIAADQACFPAGALSFLHSRRPLFKQGHIQNWVDLDRFVTIQDTGSAIRGPGRVDLYWGSGPEAGQAAGRMKEDGTLYLLLLKAGVTIASSRD